MKPEPNNQQQTTRRGFTLVEMIVAVSIFTVVTFVAVGALLAITGANRKANALRTTMDNLNFAMESMTRNIRTGTNYACAGVGDCPSDPGSSFSFLDQNGVATTYRLSADAQGVGTIMIDRGGNSLGITSTEVDVDSLRFYVSGSAAGDAYQPRVVISVKGTAGKIAKLKTAFSLQTTISQRKLDR